MDKGSRQDHARLGRLFEIELLCIRVYACACCGRTKPYADGPNSKSRVTTNFHRQNLADKYYPAFFCGCDICKGQFFCIDRSKHMKAYKEKHKMKTTLPDCMLCAHCYSEFASDGTTIFCVGRQFSARNGFGPFPELPKMCPSDFDITLKPCSLTLLPSHIQYLLSIATLAEESAFRQISPMMKLVRMKGNNLARRGVVSLVHQESVLHKILPNLPEKCVS